MLRNDPFPVTCPYDVEVSGWDRMKTFFVERCALEWNEESGKQVSIKQTLTENSVPLVRLLQPGESDRSHPVVFEAPNGLGRQRVGCSSSSSTAWFLT
jgi:hypothetical protein